MKKSEARQIHKKAEEARELKQDFDMAISLSKKAIVEYKKEDDCLGLAEIYGSLVITYKHLYQKHKSPKYKRLTRQVARKSVETAEGCGDKTALALPYFNLADYYDTVEEDYARAEENYNLALKHMRKSPPKSHADSAVILSMEAHLYACEYRNGDKSAINRLLDTASKIQKSDEKKYQRDVWSSGAYMKAADLLREDDPKKAIDCLNKAKSIIDSNSDLVLRQKQWDKLNETFS